MKYNFDSIVNYKNYENNIEQEDFDTNDIYRKNFLECFNTFEYDDTINDTLNEIYNYINKNSDFNEILNIVSNKFNIVDDNEMSIIYLFSYDYFYYFHKILHDYHHTKKVDIMNKETIIKLLQQ